jgi:hypothetical protein
MKRCLRLIPAVSLTLLACGGSDDGASPLEECRADPDADCCAIEDCDAGQACDFSYICSPAPGGGTDCSSGSGARTCLDACGAGDSCESWQECVDLEVFGGSDSGETYRVCRNLTR